MARVKAPKAESTTPRSTAAALEFWEGGEVRATNIGPIRGERLLGRIDGPGLYRFVAANARGKSTLLSLMTKLQSDRLLRSEANVTHGELSASLEIAASRVTFRKSGATGLMEPRREGIETLPKIEEIPAPIDVLITGANLKGAEPRAKARLEALLTYIPVEADEARVSYLADAMNALACAVKDHPAALATAREWLAEAASSGKIRGAGGVNFETEPELRAWINARQNEGILDAQQKLLERLNAFGNAGEHAVEVGRGRLMAALGRALEIAERSGAKLHLPEIASLPSAEEAAIAQRAAENAAAEARISYRHRIDEGARREQIRGTIGEPVDLAPLEAAVAAADAREGEAISLAEAALRERDALDNSEALRALEEAREWAAREATTVLDLCYELRLAGLEAAAQKSDFSAEQTIGAVRRFRSLVAGALDVAERRLEAFSDAQAYANSIGGRREVAQGQLDASNDDVREASTRKAVALDQLRAAREASERRLATLELLASPLPGATEDEVKAAEAKAQSAREISALVEWRGRYREAQAAAAQVQDEVAGVSALAKAYRESAAATWTALGEVVTKAVDVPFLRVEGLRIFLGYFVPAGSTVGRLATGNEEAGTIEWRDLDDSRNISTAELNQAILRLMLSRRSELGGILILPWQVIAALDDDRAREFSAEAAAAGLVVISERPRRDTDPADGGVYLEKVEAGQ